jgi:Beta-galactosidase/beta-glucuronidase
VFKKAVILFTAAILMLPAFGGRVKSNFNADWRFSFGDPAEAAAPQFNDAAWQRVGLSHSFSMPYFQTRSFYVGYGWYRKHLYLKTLAKPRRYSLEFEGAFQDAEIFVNAAPVGRHRGGYTGFSLDITPALHAGDNIIAVRVNNKWDPTLAPRAGEHVFSGGLYRDVWLVETDPVHVPWTGTRITTPNLSAERGEVTAETEIRNDEAVPLQVTVRTRIVDLNGKVIAHLNPVERTVQPGATVTVSQASGPVIKPKLWSPETPVLYHAITELSVAGKMRDVYATDFGFRWFSWSADKGFFLNGHHRYFKGANVHQDQAGWGDAVTNRAIDRDVQLMKDTGFDFIRGSHYPHDPHFAEATDKIGMLYLSEAPFWGTGGFASDWSSSAYPTNPADRAGFEASVKQQLSEMIRINRNHPSIIVWGMDNEVFFSDKAVMTEVRRLLKEMVELSHQLDPTRPAAIDGAQRGDIDHIGDIAGYNGDGAWMYPNPGVPSFVAEYGSTMEDRPGTYAPGWGDIAKVPGKPSPQPQDWHYPWRAGEAIWCGFDHGSIAGHKFGSMGLVDYARLPKRGWYWYRNAYRGIAAPAWPELGTPAAIKLTSSSPVIARADGTDDVQLVVTVVDAAGKPLANAPPVTLTIESGPGELPTGRSITFTPDGDIPIRDGQAAIALRSWQAGKSRLVASSPGLKDGVLEIETRSGPRFIPGVTPLAEDRPYRPTVDQVSEAVETSFGTNNPTGASSSAPLHGPRFVNDGDVTSYWQPAENDLTPWVMVDAERVLLLHRLLLTFPADGAYGFVAEVQRGDGSWAYLAGEPVGANFKRTRSIETKAEKGSRVRVKLVTPPGVTPGIAEIRISGVPQDR